MTTENEVKALEWAVKNLEKWPEKPTKYFGVGFDSTGPSGTRRDLIRLFAFGSGVTVYRDEWVRASITQTHNLIMDRMWKTVREICDQAAAQARAMKTTKTEPPKVTIKFNDDSSPSAVADSVRKFIEETGPIIPEQKPSKYHVIINGEWCDVYDVLNAFGVSNPADQHAIKKMLMPGKRGHKDGIKDREEAIASLKRAIELEKSR